MNTRIAHRLETNLVFLLKDATPAELRPPELEDAEAWLSAPVTLTPTAMLGDTGLTPGAGYTLRSPVAQMEALLTPERLMVRDESGKEPREEVVSAACKILTHHQFDWYAFGCNYRLVIRPPEGEPAGSYILRTMFGHARLQELGRLTGGLATLVFERDGCQYTLRFEPRYQRHESTQVFVDANVHRQEDGSAKTEVHVLAQRITHAFRHGYEEVLGVVNFLAEGEADADNAQQ